MKYKLKLGIFLLFFVSFLVAENSIVNSPTEGERWSKLGIHKIKWLNIGPAVNKISIVLYNKRGKKKVKEIAKNIKNKGEYICSIDTFADIPEGEYKIFLVSSRGEIIGESGVFNIVESNVNNDKKIKIKIPYSSIIIHQGSKLRLEWKTKKRMPVNFLIELYTADKMKKIMRIKQLIPKPVGLYNRKPRLRKSFEFIWEIPRDLKDGVYLIKISLPKDKIYAFTPPIKIAKTQIRRINRYGER